MRVEHAYAGNKLIFPVSCPFAWGVVRSDCVLDRYDRCWRRGAGNYIAKDCFLSASTARAPEDTYITSLSRGVVAVDYGEVRRKPESLALGKSVHTSVMIYRHK